LNKQVLDEGLSPPEMLIFNFQEIVNLKNLLVQVSGVEYALN
jgi:hypothetical protein